MKRVFLVFTLAAFAMIAFSSCEKEKTCTCTTSYSGDGSEFMSETTSTFTTEEDCSDGNSEVTTMGLTATTKCKEE
jgi:hypothetical protein